MAVAVVVVVGGRRRRQCSNCRASMLKIYTRQVPKAKSNVLEGHCTIICKPRYSKTLSCPKKPVSTFPGSEGGLDVFRGSGWSSVSASAMRLPIRAPLRVPLRVLEGFV